MNKDFKAGIVSVTFRQYAYENFIKYTKLTDLSCVERGSDIHVPYNDIEKALKVSKKMQENNLETVSYASYYRLGISQQRALLINAADTFTMILQIAGLIEAPSIRVWGGELSSARLDANAKKAIIDDTIRIAALAKASDKDISLEYHSNTITDNAESAVDFIKAVRDGGGSNVYLYWQPNQNITFEKNKAELKKICPYLTNIHVFAWQGNERFPLEHHRDIWREYIDIIAEHNHGGGNAKHNFLLEFVKDDSVEQCIEDAKTLIELLN